jgi:enoyl-CoA hydratase
MPFGVGVGALRSVADAETMAFHISPRQRPEVLLMIHRKDRDHIAILCLEHGKAHALDVELSQALTDTVSAVADDESTRAMVLTGTGSIFCAGVDLFRVLNGGVAYVDEFVPALVGAFRTLFTFPKPAVAAINGHAIAGGCVLAAACDYRIMARGGGTIGVPELRVGVPFPQVAIEILRFATSTAHLQELVYRGKTYGVSDAYDRGLIDEIVDPAVLLDDAGGVAARLGSEPAARFRITKRQLRQPALDRMEWLGKETDGEVLAQWKHPTTIEAIQSYVEEMIRKKK